MTNTAERDDVAYAHFAIAAVNAELQREYGKAVAMLNEERKVVNEARSRVQADLVEVDNLMKRLRNERRKLRRHLQRAQHRMFLVTIAFTLAGIGLGAVAGSRVARHYAAAPQK